MSVRDDPVLFLRGGKTSSGGGAVGGGAAITTTRPHKLDGAEHQAADDTTRLDATTDRHGLMPKLSGDAGDVMHGDGAWTPTTPGMMPTVIADGATFTVPAGFQALFAMTIDVAGTLAVDGYLVEVD